MAKEYTAYTATKDQYYPGQPQRNPSNLKYPGDHERTDLLFPRKAVDLGVTDSMLQEALDRYSKKGHDVLGVEKPSKFYRVIEITTKKLQGMYPGIYVPSPEQFLLLTTQEMKELYKTPEDWKNRHDSELEDMGATSTGRAPYNSSLNAFSLSMQLPPVICINAERVNVEDRNIVMRTRAEFMIASMIVNVALYQSIVPRDTQYTHGVQEALTRALDFEKRFFSDHPNVDKAKLASYVKDLRERLSESRFIQPIFEGAQTLLKDRVGNSDEIVLTAGTTLNSSIRTYLAVEPNIQLRADILKSAPEKFRREAGKALPKPYPDAEETKAKKLLDAIGLKNDSEIFKAYRESRIPQMLIDVSSYPATAEDFANLEV